MELADRHHDTRVARALPNGYAVDDVEGHVVRVVGTSRPCTSHFFNHVVLELRSEVDHHLNQRLIPFSAKAWPSQ